MSLDNDVRLVSMHADKWRSNEFVVDNNINIFLSAIEFDPFDVCFESIWDDYFVVLKESKRLVIFSPSFFLNKKTVEHPSLNDVARNSFLYDGLEVMSYISGKFNGAVYFIFWDLFCDQILDRLSGLNIKDGRYISPCIDLSLFSICIENYNVIDLTPLLSMKMHEVVRLISDDSSCLTKIGYLFINNLLIDKTEVLSAYRSAIDSVESELINLARSVSAYCGSKVLITGRSVWIDTLLRYMGESGVLRLYDAGVLIAPINRTPGQMVLSDFINEVDLKNYPTIVVSGGGLDLFSLLADSLGESANSWSNVPRVDWEAISFKHIVENNNKPNLMHYKSTVPIGSFNGSNFTFSSKMLDPGEKGIPSWYGLASIFNLILSNEITPQVRSPCAGTDFVSTHHSKIESGALLTQSGIAFLVGGNHDVLKFCTGELKPRMESISNFHSNIESRVSFSKRFGVTYLHIIFPDKQSVLSHEFPYQPVYCLGDIYLSNLKEHLLPKVIYPVEGLRACEYSPFLPLDTHLTDHGSLEVIKIILPLININADISLERIKNRIIKNQRWMGDLGSKFNPVLYQDGLVLDPDWSFVFFQNSIGLNDGMVNIFLNPEAQFEKTVLLFGDSFFRMMLPQLSAIFTRIVFLRTRFLHEEMINMIQPDIVLSGNAERYLSSVQLDKDAHIFSLYGPLRGHSYDLSDACFLQAWQAITSPSSSYSRHFFKNLSVQ